MQNRRDYPDNWNDEIRPSILKRDNYQCVECGIKHRVYVLIDQSKKRIIIDKDEFLEYKKEGWNTYKIYLQVSHINNIKADCSPANLRTLCNQCHAKADKEWKKVARISAPIIDMYPCTNKLLCPYAHVPHCHSESGQLIMF
jgi:5-methylcytosine-specific restriction endonuclease McrA